MTFFLRNLPSSNPSKTGALQRIDTWSRTVGGIYAQGAARHIPTPLGIYAHMHLHASYQSQGILSFRCTWADFRWILHKIIQFWVQIIRLKRDRSKNDPSFWHKAKWLVNQSVCSHGAGGKDYSWIPNQKSGRTRTTLTSNEAVKQSQENLVRSRGDQRYKIRRISNQVFSKYLSPSGRHSFSSLKAEQNPISVDALHVCSNNWIPGTTKSWLAQTSCAFGRPCCGNFVLM